MIDLLPLPDDPLPCAHCPGTELKITRFLMPGMMPLAEAHCPSCKRRYVAHLNLGFGYNRQIMVDMANGRVSSFGAQPWYVDRVMMAINTRARPTPPMAVHENRPLGDDIIIINAIEPTYGHTLQNLFAAAWAKETDPETPILMIVPHYAAWLVPDWVAQTWIVTDTQRDGHLWNDAVRIGLERLLPTVRRARLLGLSFMLPMEIDVEAFTRVKPMHFTGLGSAAPPRLTVNWREDRCWTYRGRELPREAAIADQLDLVARMLRALREEMPDLDAAVTGYGRTGQFDDWVKDLRLGAHDTDMERQWMRRYAQSHAVFGVHGSNMILPAAHAYNSVEIVNPTQHNFVTWEWVNRMSAQEALLRYTGVPRSTSLSEIATIVFIKLRRAQHAMARHLPQSEQIALLTNSPRFNQNYELTVTDQNGQAV